MVNCAPGGLAATSETATSPSVRRNHSRWLTPVPMPSARSAVRRQRYGCRRIAGGRPRAAAAPSTGSTGSSQHVQRARACSASASARPGDREARPNRTNARPRRRTPRASNGAAADWREGAQTVGQRLLAVHAKGVARRGAGRRLDHQRESHAAGELPGLGRGADQRVSSAGQPRLAQDLLHSRLVPEVACRDASHALDPLRLAHLGQRNLELLQRPEQRSAPGPM